MFLFISSPSVIYLSALETPSLILSESAAASLSMSLPSRVRRELISFYCFCLSLYFFFFSLFLGGINIIMIILFSFIKFCLIIFSLLINVVFVFGFYLHRLIFSDVLKLIILLWRKINLWVLFCLFQVEIFRISLFN